MAKPAFVKDSTGRIRPNPILRNLSHASTGENSNYPALSNTAGGGHRGSARPRQESTRVIEAREHAEFAKVHAGRARPKPKPAKRADEEQVNIFDNGFEPEQTGPNSSEQEDSTPTAPISGRVSSPDEDHETEPRSPAARQASNEINRSQHGGLVSGRMGMGASQSKPRERKFTGEDVAVPDRAPPRKPTNMEQLEAQTAAFNSNRLDSTQSQQSQSQLHRKRARSPAPLTQSSSPSLVTLPLKRAKTGSGNRSSSPHSSFSSRSFQGLPPTRASSKLSSAYRSSEFDGDQEDNSIDHWQSEEAFDVEEEVEHDGGPGNSIQAQPTLTKKKKKQPTRLHDLEKRGLLEEKAITEDALEPFKARVVTQDMYMDRQALIAQAHNTLNEVSRKLGKTNMKISPQMTEVLLSSITSYRSAMLGVFREVAATAYGFCDLDKTQRPVEANMTRVVKLLEGSLFTFKDMSKPVGPYRAKTITNCINQLWFQHGENSFGIRYQNWFSPIPLQLIAFVCAGLEHAIGEWKTGHFKKVDFKETNVKPSLRQHWQTLKDLKDTDGQATYWSYVQMTLYKIGSKYANVEYCEPPPQKQLSQDHYLDQVYDSAEESDDNWKEYRKEAQDELEYVLQEGREGVSNEANHDVNPVDEYLVPDNAQDGNEE